MESRYVDSKQACRMLSIQPQTLYAYVSRGLIRSEAATGKSRARRYHRQDVEALQRRRQARTDPSAETRHALRAGEPVLESRLTLIADDGLFYRGQDALVLARGHTLEQVASLMWLGDIEADLGDPGLDVSPVSGVQGLSVLRRMQATLPVAAAQDPTAGDLQPAAMARTGWRILHLLAAIASDTTGGGSISERLQAAWCPDRTEAQPLIEAALVLCADHELNVSAFTARCVASSGADLYAAIGAALAALSGFRHGGASLRVEALFREIDADGDVRRVVADRLVRGDTIPGFGHAVYPGLDPRARVLLEMIGEVAPDAMVDVDALRDAVRAARGLEANVDIALVALCRALGLPAKRAIVLFCLARTVGWTAHAIEQVETGTLIRPRAAYAGAVPA